MYITSTGRDVYIFDDFDDVMKIKNKCFFEILRSGLWKNFTENRGIFDDYPPFVADWEYYFRLAEEQAITGIFIQSLERNLAELRYGPSQELLLQEICKSIMIQERNAVMNRAVVGLCKLLETCHSRFVLFKGQSLAALYGDKGPRQSGDIDFYVHPEDWEKTFQLCCDAFHIESVDTHSEKHIGWESDGVVYEMHRMLNSFFSKKHQKYWDNVIIKDAWRHPWFVAINGYDVPTLAPTYNAIYVFVHLFFHLISEGVGLRQFIDWGVVLEKGKDDIDRCLLRKYLEGIGLLKAYTGFGAVLTDYLGFPIDAFTFEIKKKTTWVLLN